MVNPLNWLKREKAPKGFDIHPDDQMSAMTRYDPDVAQQSIEQYEGSRRLAGEGKPKSLLGKAGKMAGGVLNSPLLFMAPMLIPQGGGGGSPQAMEIPPPYLDSLSRQMMMDQYNQNNLLQAVQAGRY